METQRASRMNRSAGGEASVLGANRTWPGAGRSRSGGHGGPLRAAAARPVAARAVGDHGLRVAQDVAAAPDRLDVVLAAGGGHQLLAQLADEDVDDLYLGFIHPAIEMVEEHLL